MLATPFFSYRNADPTFLKKNVREEGNESLDGALWMGLWWTTNFHKPY
jgi:hypothetical protein